MNDSAVMQAVQTVQTGNKTAFLALKLDKRQLMNLLTLLQQEECDKLSLQWVCSIIDCDRMFMFACKSNVIDMVEICWNFVTPSTKAIAILEAIRLANIEVVLYCEEVKLAHIDVSIALNYACQSLNSFLVNRYLAKHPQPYSWGFLMTFACIKDSISHAEISIQNGWSLNKEQFFHACRQGSIDIIKTYLPLFLQLDCADEALTLAITHHQYEVILFLSHVTSAKVERILCISDSLFIQLLFNNVNVCIFQKNRSFQVFREYVKMVYEFSTAIWNNTFPKPLIDLIFVYFVGIH